MTESPQKHRQRPENDWDQERRHVKVWILVGLSMVLIVSIWVITLPSQLRLLQPTSDENIQRWEVIKEENGATSFKEAFGELRGTLSKFEERFSEETGEESVLSDTEEESITNNGGHLPLTEQESTIEHEFEMLKARLESNTAE